MSRMSRQIVVCVVLLSCAMTGHAEEPNDAKIELLLQLRENNEKDMPFYGVNIAIRNIGDKTLPSAEILDILGDCVIHISTPNGTAETWACSDWRGFPPRDTPRGNVAERGTIINTSTGAPPVFPMEQTGRYIMWWTAKSNRSNSIVFERTKDGLKAWQ